MNPPSLVCFLAIMLLIPVYARRARVKQDGDIVKFLHVSDFHFDPYYDESAIIENYCHSSQEANETADYKAPYGRIGCDTPEWLLDSTMRAMRGNSHGAKFMVLSGDSSAHGLTDDHGSKKVLKTMGMVSVKAHKVFPDIPIFPCFGNNDLPGHYVLPTSSEWYKIALFHWAPLILCTGCPDEVEKPTTREELEKTFLEGGFYSVNIADGKMVLIVVNSMYWNNNRYTNPMVEQIADEQFLWFENQLQRAKDQGKKVIIMSHIPPGGDPHDFHFFWVPQYAKRYVELVAGEYPDVVAGQLYGHVHRDDFHLQILGDEVVNSGQNPRKSFVLTAPSVSPVYSNNPAFRVMSLNKKKKALVDYKQYYLDLVIATEFSNPVWQLDYTFSKKYPSTNKLIDADRIDDLNQQLISQTDGTYWKAYIFSTQVNYRPDAYDRLTRYCVMRHVFEEDFKKCHEKFKVSGG